MRNPYISGARIAWSFTKRHLCIVILVYRHLEIVAIGQGKSGLRQIGVARYKTRNPDGCPKMYIHWYHYQVSMVELKVSIVLNDAKYRLICQMYYCLLSWF